MTLGLTVQCPRTHTLNICSDISSIIKYTESYFYMTAYEYMKVYKHPLFIN